MDRRQFIKTSGYTAVAGGSGLLLPTAAHAADDIAVGSIHDLSGGLEDRKSVG